MRGINGNCLRKTRLIIHVLTAERKKQKNVVGAFGNFLYDDVICGYPGLKDLILTEVKKNIGLKFFLHRHFLKDAKNLNNIIGLPNPVVTFKKLKYESMQEIERKVTKKSPEQKYSRS